MGLISQIAQSIYPLRKKLISIFRTAPVGSADDHHVAPAKTIFDYHIEGIDGKDIDFKKFRGKKLLLVNTASECGFTPQYAPLQKLHEQYGDRLSVIGFPSNNFGAQEPGSEEEIMSFCERNYGVTFPLSKKIDVTGPGKHEVFQWLTKKDLNGWNDSDPNWNFCKYLVDENGRLIHFFSHKMDPLDEKIISKITSN